MQEKQPCTRVRFGLGDCRRLASPARWRCSSTSVCAVLAGRAAIVLVSSGQVRSLSVNIWDNLEGMEGKKRGNMQDTLQLKCASTSNYLSEDGGSKS